MRDATQHVRNDYFSDLRDKHDLTGLSAIRVLLVDNDMNISGLTQNILKQLGLTNVSFARSGTEALKEMEERAIDLIISEWPMYPQGNMDIVRYIRQHSEARYRTIPIILLTAQSHKETVYDARDAGMTEFVVKPFTVQALCSRLINIIENPRNFVMAPTYVGPDRRRIEKKGAPDNGRMSEEERKKNSTRKGRQTIIKTKKGEVVVEDPDYRIRMRIGKDTNVRQLFSQEAVAKAQKVLQENLGEFLNWVGVDMIWLEHNYTLLKKGVDPEERLKQMADISLSIKSKTGVFSYNLASEIADSLYDYVRHIDKKTKDHDVVIRKHLDILYVIFHKNLDGNGGIVGQEIASALYRLKERFPIRDINAPK